MAFENNVQATLQANVAIGATTVDVVKAVAPNKDVPVSGRLTLSATGKTEIISYTGRTDNTTYWTLTGVTKNAESSFGDQAWSAGDACFQALTAADVASLSTIHSATVPTNPTVGTKWFNTTTGVLQEYLTDGTDFAWLDISAGAIIGVPAALSATVIAPAAQGYINSENDGTAAGCSYVISGGGGTATVTFNTPMTDTNYSVITDKEGFDEHQVLTGNKSLTSFTMLSRDSAGTQVMSPNSWPYSFVVYASDPVQNVLANKGDTGATGPAGSSTLSGLSDSTVATTDPLITSNPSAIGHLWINSTTANAYICTDITTGSNVWINIGRGTTGVSPFTGTGGTESTYSSGGINYKVHTFTSSGTFTTAGLSAGSVSVLTVAGGGGGGSTRGGGGGAGGHLSGTLSLAANQSYTVTVGAGGVSGKAVNYTRSGWRGGNSVFSTMTAIGGGGGIGEDMQLGTEGTGGSGGGACGSHVMVGLSGTVGQGNNGGNATYATPNYGGGGGGGAGAVGANSTNTTGGNGGNGLASSITGSSVTYAGGGGGGTYWGGTSGSGGSGGGGDAGVGGANSVGIAGLVNTGGGGGGSSFQTARADGGNGGSGIVIVRYAI
jgi:hypothetical protein